MADGNRFFPAPRLILAGLVAGVLAGAVAVYVSESGSGNNAPEKVATVAGKDDAACAAEPMRTLKSSFWKRNGLSLVLTGLFLLFLVGQVLTGWSVDNEARVEAGRTPLALAAYLHSGHFISATFENWESEFLQMGMYVLLTVWLMPATWQFAPGRIDHHNVQIALTLWLLVAAGTPGMVAAALAGLASAAMLAVGMETLPYVGVAAALAVSPDERPVLIAT